MRPKRRRTPPPASGRGLGAVGRGGGDGGEPPDPAADCARRDELEHLQAAIANLPDYLRHVLVLREFGELDYDVIASALGITAASARQYRHRAIRKLAERLGGLEGRANDD